MINRYNFQENISVFIKKKRTDRNTLLYFKLYKFGRLGITSIKIYT